MTTFNNLISQIKGKNASMITRSVRTRSSKYSMGIVRSERNGKRISFSSALVDRLELEDTVFITAFPTEGLLILGSTAYSEDSTEFYLRDNKGHGKLCYNASLVEFLINAFDLDYSDHVSKTFTDITFSEDANPPMAIVKLETPLPVKAATPETIEAEDDFLFDEDWDNDEEDHEEDHQDNA